MSTAIDPILCSVIVRRLEAITREMGLALLRTTRSPVFNEAKDFATGLYDARGQLIGQTEFIPILAFAIPGSIQAVLAQFGDDIHPGDVFLHNDVYSGCNQSQDVTAMKPVFHSGELMFWAATKGHQVDVGGSTIGGYNPHSGDIWQETLRIPALRVHAGGQVVKDAWNLLMANTRMPAIVGGDLQAQIGACVVGERHLVSLVEKYGAEVLRTHLAAILESTEARMRDEIRKMPRGTFRGEAQNDGDEIDPDRRYTVRATVTVGDGELAVDFSGTDPQAHNYVNVPLQGTISATILTVLMFVDPSIPRNEGIKRAIRIHAPEGTLVNPRFPAATAHGNFTANDLVCEAIIKALAQCLPDRVTAGWQRFITGPMTGIDPRSGRRFVDTPFLASKGGMGATRGMDGWNYLGKFTWGGSVKAQDYEMFEIQDPHLLIKQEFCPDSEGAGEWRGGFGTETVFECYAENPFAIIHGDGTTPDTAPFGLFGGQAGCPNAVVFTNPGEAPIRSHSKQNHHLKQGVRVAYVASGGGGYGSPWQRRPELVQADVRSGLVSLERAHSVYGVVLAPDSLNIDPAATAARRAIMQRAQGQPVPG